MAEAGENINTSDIPMIFSTFRFLQFEALEAPSFHLRAPSFHYFSSKGPHGSSPILVLSVLTNPKSFEAVRGGGGVGAIPDAASRRCRVLHSYLS